MVNMHKASSISLLFVAPSAYPLGGVAVWLRYILHGLADKGFNVHLGLLSGKFHKPDEYLAEHSFEKDKVNIVSIGSGSGTREGRVCAITQAIENVQADIVVSVNAPDVFEAGTRVKKLSNSSLKTVMTLHGLEPDYFLDIRTYCSQIDAVIATNRLTCLMVEQWANFSSERILYAPYGVEMPEGNGQEQTMTDTPLPLKILYAGRIEQEQKRINDLIDLVSELERSEFVYHLMLAGDGKHTDSVMKELGNKVKYGQLTYLGNLSHEELFEKGYSVADVLILLSDWETGPIVIWEAMAHGLAIVSSQYHGSVAEEALVHDTNSLLFPVGDVVSAAESVMRLNDYALRQRLISNAYDLVEKRYSREQSIDQWSRSMVNIKRDIHSKPAVPWRHAWQKKGMIERVFGHACGHKVRLLTGKYAFQNSAGSEWPHSLSKVPNEVKRQFSLAIQDAELR